ncbi:hypothetical protein GCM10009412_29830 [Aeromonas salmonicida subsp. achromogenes]
MRGMVVLRSLGFQLVPFKLHRFRKQRRHELEQQFCDTYGCQHAVALNSATAGMHVTLMALGIGPGDEVITPSQTWVSTINLITLLGAEPVFVDVDRDTLMTSAELIAPLITVNTKAIIPVHYAGAPVDLDPILKLARQYDIPVIEDAAHAIGTRYRDRWIGATGTAIFSFHGRCFLNRCSLNGTN